MSRNIPLFYLVRFLRYAQLWVPVWVIYLTEEQGFSLAQVTTADAVFFLSTMLLEVPTGAVADRWGRARSVALGALSLVVALFFFAFTHSYTLLLVSFLWWALAEALNSGADVALLYDSLRALGREHEYERHAGRGIAATWAGVGVATLLGGPFTALLSTQATIFIGMGTTTLTAALAFAMREAPRHSEGQVQHRYLEGMALAFRTVGRDRVLRSVLIFLGLTGACLGGQGYLVQPFLRDAGIDVGFWFSALQLPIQAGGILGALLAATIAARAGDMRILIIGVALAGLAYTTIWASPAAIGMAILFVSPTLEGVVDPVATGYLNRRIAPDQRATILSMRSFAHGLFVAPLAPLVGIVADRHGVDASFGLLAVVVLMGGLGASMIWVRAAREHERSSMAATADGTA